MAETYSTEVDLYISYEEIYVNKEIYLCILTCLYFPKPILAVKI